MNVHKANYLTCFKSLLTTLFCKNLKVQTTFLSFYTALLILSWHVAPSPTVYNMHIDIYFLRLHRTETVGTQYLLDERMHDTPALSEILERKTIWKYCTTLRGIFSGIILFLLIHFWAQHFTNFNVQVNHLGGGLVKMQIWIQYVWFGLGLGTLRF